MQTSKQINLILITLIIIWGISWPVTKIGIQYISPIWFVFLRLTIATCVLFIVVIWSGQFLIPRRRDIPVIFAIGILQISLFMIFSIIGLAFVDPARSAILVYTTPLWVTPVAIAIFKEKINSLKLIGLGLGIIGILTLFSPWSIDWNDHKLLFGNLCLLFSSILWASAMLCARYMIWHSSTLSLIPWQMLLATVITGFIILIFQIPPHIQGPHQATLWLCLFYIGVLATAFGYWGIVAASKALPVITTSLSMLVIPVVGLIASNLMVREPITPQLLSAMLIIISGLVCVIFGKQK